MRGIERLILQTLLILLENARYPYGHSIQQIDYCIEEMKKKGIGTNYGAQCMPFQKYFQKKYNLNCEILFPHALRANKQGMVLPLYGNLTEHDIYQVTSKIKEAIN